MARSHSSFLCPKIGLTFWFWFPLQKSTLLLCTFKSPANHGFFFNPPNTPIVQKSIFLALEPFGPKIKTFLLCQFGFNFLKFALIFVFTKPPNSLRAKNCFCKFKTKKKENGRGQKKRKKAPTQKTKGFVKKKKRKKKFFGVF